MAAKDSVRPGRSSTALRVGRRFNAVLAHANRVVARGSHMEPLPKQWLKTEGRSELDAFRLLARI